jgi:sulfoxide reductase heme-binding subunit YedZ
MGLTYKAIGWNQQKVNYDLAIAVFVILYLFIFTTTTIIFQPDATFETILIRATSTLALLLLHIILAIGPLARLNERFLPLLYNRRHLGVTMFSISAIHGIFSIIQFHALGNINPIVSLFLSNTNYDVISKFPFEALGFFALVIFSLMAFTSHDFWLNILSPAIWKALHMMVYLAYALIVLHVIFGALQYETSPVYVTVLIFGLSILISLHLCAALQENKLDSKVADASGSEMIYICQIRDIPENRARVVSLAHERVAVFKHGNKISAVSNVCKHQHGPLGEGKIIDGCITCPWHGYQYDPGNGRAPEPFKEKIATYNLQLIGEDIWLDPIPLAEGMPSKNIIFNNLINNHETS